MYLTEITIQNIRAIRSLTWSLVGQELGAWNVVLGDNGSGKSSFLRAVSLALIGTTEAAGARQNWNEWLTAGASEGVIQIRVEGGPDDPWHEGNDVHVGLERKSDRVSFMRGSETRARAGFSAAYGPFRRFSGGDKDAHSVFFSVPVLGAHISVFGEDVALTEALPWLRDLKFKKFEKQPEGELLEPIVSFINQGTLLPQGVRLAEVSSRTVEFQDANGCRVSVENLGDGFRSILSLTFELIRQMSQRFPVDQIFDPESKCVVVPGVVLIDEVDAHLHPTWQKEIGFTLTKLFPDTQFIVTTHSPLVCHAAVNGTIFRLRAPGSNEECRMLTGTERARLVYGNILDGYSTEAFGTSQTRSPLASAKLKRLAELNVREMRNGLTDSELLEQEELRAWFPTMAGRTE